MNIALILITIGLAVSAFKALKWKVTALSMIYYMEIKHYPQPNPKETQECIKFVISNMLKDPSGRKR